LTKDQDTADKTKAIVKAAGKPVSCDYVAYHLDVSWQTARAILLRLALRGEITATDTTKSWILA
jgi:predicted Rossmann fold nucleotide-binding protein DprA/Smf involved in DNA uptake